MLEQYWDVRPENREKLRALAREGRFAVEPGLYAVPDMNLLDGESMFMQASVGRKIVSEKLVIYPPRMHDRGLLGASRAAAADSVFLRLPLLRVLALHVL